MHQWCPVLVTEWVGGSWGVGEYQLLTPYNTQPAGGQQLPHPRTVVNPVPVLSAALSEPEIINCLDRDIEESDIV